MRSFASVGQRHDGDDLVAPALAGPTGDHDVDHGRVRGDGGLDLFGEDLLAAGVDAVAAATKNRNRIVVFQFCGIACQ